MLNDQSDLSSEELLVFDLDKQFSLYRDTGEDKAQYLRLLEYRIRRNPQDLLRHAQRIVQYLEPEYRENLLGALTDLFIALGEHGRAFRARMLSIARPYVSDQDYRYFSDYLKRGMHPCRARHVRYSSLSAGYEVNTHSPGCHDDTAESVDIQPAQDTDGSGQKAGIERTRSPSGGARERDSRRLEKERTGQQFAQPEKGLSPQELMASRLQNARFRWSGKWSAVKDSLTQPVSLASLGRDE